MIPYSVPLILLLLVASTTRADGPLPTFDWNECKSGKSLCYTRGDCVNHYDDDLTLLQYLLKFPDQSNCALGASLRTVTKNEWRVRLRIAEAIDPAMGIHVYHGDQMIVGCKQDSAGIIAEGKDGLTLEMIGTESAFNAAGGFCSVRINDTSSLAGAHEVVSIRFTKGGQTTGTIVKMDAKSDLHKQVYDYFFCDPAWLTRTKKGITGYKKIDIPDKFADTITCPAGSELFIGPLANPDEAGKVTDLKCDKNKKKYTFTNENGDVIDYESHEIYCAIPIDTTCLPLDQRAGIVGPTMKGGSSGKKTLECATKKHVVLVNGKFYLTDQEKLQCKTNKKSADVGAWFAENKTGELVPVETAECTEKYKCTLVSTFNNKPPNLIKTKGVEGRVKVNETYIYCSSAGKFLVVLEDKTRYTPASIVCNGADGRWMMKRTGEQDLALSEKANVYCEKPPEEDPAAMAAANLGWKLGFGIPAVVLVLVTAAIPYLIYRKRRQAWEWDGVLPVLPPSEKETQEQKAERKAAERKQLAEEMVEWRREYNKWRPWEYKLKPKQWNAVAPKAKRAFVKFVIKRNVPHAPDPYKPRLPMMSETDDEKQQLQDLQYELMADEDYRERKRIFQPNLLMDTINCLFNYEYQPFVWKEMLPFLFFMERDFFHVDQTMSDVPEKERAIPGGFYEHFRKYLLRMSAEVIKRFDGEVVTEIVDGREEAKKADKKEPKREAGGKEEEKEEDKKDGDDGENEEAEKQVKETPKEPKKEAIVVKGPVSGFIKGVAYLIQYKLLTDKEEKEKLLDKIFADYEKDRMGMKGASRFAVWGILRHEDCPIIRRKGVHEYFGPASKSTVMYDELLAEFNELLKKDGDFPRAEEGTKMQHILFAMGCSVERSAMSEVWKAMNSDQRFWPEDFMWAMYGRDWLWDGAWSVMTQAPSENYLFSKRFGQHSEEYKELAEMCTRYWADKYSEDAKKGYCFESLALQYDPNFRPDLVLPKIYERADRWEKHRSEYATTMYGWLVDMDPTNTSPNYTPKGEKLVEEAKARPPTAETKELAELANQTVPKKQPDPPNAGAKAPTKPPASGGK